MEYIVEIEGVSGLIMHSGSGLDPRHPNAAEKQEITSKRGTNRTVSDDERLRQLECITSLWLNAKGAPAIPTTAIRASLETAARKNKEGAQVREGLVVLETAFTYDTDRYGVTEDELGLNAQFTIGVVVQRSRVLRTRAKFDPPWSCRFKLETDEDLVDEQRLRRWLEISGRRIGLGDWRPEKSGEYGRFMVVGLEPVAKD